MLHIGSEFSARLQDLIREERITRIVETGTNDGSGSTTALVEALPPAGKLFTIECVPVLAELAGERFAADNRVTVSFGLSIPRFMLPSSRTTRERIRLALSQGFAVDHPDERGYEEEVGFPHGPTDLLGSCTFRPELLLLDSAGHMGLEEATRVLALWPSGPLLIALDDTAHVKHFLTVPALLDEAGFQLVWQTREKNGAVILRRP